MGLSKGYKFTEEHKQNIGRALKGKHHSEETKLKISLAHRGKRGRIVSEETKLKIRKNHADFSGENNPMFGKHKTPEAIEKTRLTKMGNKYTWKGGRNKTPLGYIVVFKPGHPNHVYKYVLEHRLVMEEFLGRFLTREEVVHHINETRDNNCIENLMLFASEGEHRRYHAKLKQEMILKYLRQRAILRAIPHFVTLL